MLNVLAQKLNDAFAAELLRPDEAVSLAWMDMEVSRQALTRARGCVRPNYATGGTYNVLFSGVAKQRTGTALLLYQDAGGSLYMQPEVVPANTDADY